MGRLAQAPAFCAITNRRVLILQEGWKRKTQFPLLESMPEISCDGNDVGTLWLSTKLPVLGGRSSSTRSTGRFSFKDGVPTLAEIDNIDSVYHLILDLREHARKQSPPQT